MTEENSLKRGAPVEPTDGLDQAKRARLGAELPADSDHLAKVPPLPLGPVSFARLFTLTDSDDLASFDVNQLPVDMVQAITVPLLQRIDRGLLDTAIEVGLMILR